MLTTRYLNNRIYTSIGPVLIAVNPYKPISTGKMGLYDQKVAFHYYAHAAQELGPHIYKIGSEAYNDLRARYKSQCVIVTGEVSPTGVALEQQQVRWKSLCSLPASLAFAQCGAGKTETAKQLMNFLTTICGAYSEKSQSVGEADPLVSRCQ